VLTSTEREELRKLRRENKQLKLEREMMDNAAARDFLPLLPMTLTLEDYAATEKISHLPKKLSVASAPAGFDPSVGDLTYYAPWGNLAIF
jgi:hypothetical protein